MQRFFLLYCFWTAVGCLYGGAGVVAHFMLAQQSTFCSAQCSMGLVATMLICVMFGCFTACMLSEQISAIMRGGTTVEFHSSKPKDNDHLNGMERLGLVMGGKPSLFWLLPLPLAGRNVVSDDVFV